MKKVLVFLIGCVLASVTAHCATVGEVRGVGGRPSEVDVQSAEGNWVPATNGIVIGNGSTIRTGKIDLALLSLEENVQLFRVYPDSLLEIESERNAETPSSSDRQTVLKLPKGIIVGSIKRHLASPWVIKTRTGIVEIAFGEFEVRSDGAVIVQTGKAFVRVASKRIAVRAGNQYDPIHRKVVAKDPNMIIADTGVMFVDTVPETPELWQKRKF